MKKVTRDLLQQLADKACDMKAIAPPRFPPSPYYRFFLLLAETLHPTLSVELGLCGGGGSYHLASGWPHGYVIGVDVVNDYPDNIEYVELYCPNFEFWQMDSIAAAKVAKIKKLTVDILFIDTVHTLHATLAEWAAWRGILSDESVVCFDDIDRLEMGNFWDKLQEPKMRLNKLHHQDGFGVKWK